MFLNETRESWLQLDSYTYSANGVEMHQLPQVGLLSRILIPMQLHVQAVLPASETLSLNNGVASHSILPEILPYSLIKRIRLVTNEGAELYNTSGVGNILHQMCRRERVVPSAGSVPPNIMLPGAPTHDSVYVDPYGQSVASGQPFVNSGIQQTIDSVTAVISDVTGTTTAVDFYINVIFDLDVAWGDQLSAGLVLLQNPRTRVQLELTYGSFPIDTTTADMANATGGGNYLFKATTLTGLTFNSATITIVPCMQFFNLPANPQDYPDLSMLHLVLEETVPISNSGPFRYNVPLANTYLNLIQQFVKGSGATATRPTPGTDITGISLSYAETQTPYNLTHAQQLALQRYRRGSDIDDSVLWWSFTAGNGLIELPSARDIIDTSRLTNLAFVTTLGPAYTSGSMRAIREVLSPVVG